MQLLFLLFSSYFASLFCLYLNTRYADLKVPFDMMGHIWRFPYYINKPSLIYNRMDWVWYTKILVKLWVFAKKLCQANAKHYSFKTHTRPIYLSIMRKNPFKFIIIMLWESDWNNGRKPFLTVPWNFTTLVTTGKPNNTGNHKKSGWESPKILILSGKHFGAKQKRTMKSEGNHPKCWFWAESTLEPNNTLNHDKWREPPKILILSRKHFGVK